MTRVVVEAAFGNTLADAVFSGGSWTDITQYTEIQTRKITITRGAQSQLSQTQAGTLSLTLDNADGRFTPENTGSPYYPNVIDGVPIRVSIATYTTNLVLTPSFEGTPDGSFDGWVWSQATPLIVGTPVQSGTKAARVNWDTGAVGAYFQTVVYGLTVGGRYTASVYVRVPAGDVPARIRMGGVTSSASAVNDAYTRLTVTFTATSVVMPLQVIPSTAPAAGDFVYVDAVQVEAGSTATTFSATGAQLHPRFWGLVTQWPIQWEGLLAVSTVTATDIFSVLSRSEDQMRPMLVQESLLWGPKALWALDEPSGAMSAGDEAAAGAGALAVTQAGAGGTLDFGGGTAPLGISGAPQFSPASASAGSFLRGSAGSAFQVGTAGPWLAEVWFSTTTAGRAFLALASANLDSALVFYLAAGTGYLTVESRQGGTTVTTTVGGTSLANGVPHHVVYSSAAQELYVDGVSIGAFGAIQAVSDLTTVTVGANHLGSAIWAGAVSTVALYADPDTTPGALASHYTCGTTGFAGETADERVQRLVSYTGLGFRSTGAFSTGIAEQAALGSTALDHLRDVESTEGGILLATRDGPFVWVQGRSVRYNPAPALSITWGDLEPGDVELAYDLQSVVNSVVVTRPGGATQRLVNAASRAARGPIGRTVETLATSDLVTADIANWILQRHSAPRPELRALTVEVYTLGITAYRQWLAVDVSTPLTVASLPAQAPAVSLMVTAEGYTETISEAQHVLAFHTSRSETASVWVLDDATYSVLGSSTRLAY